MSDLTLLTDGSVCAESKVGYGAYLLLPEQGLALAEPQRLIQLRRFEQTSSTRLELQTLLWALAAIRASHHKVTIYTDSQNIIGLPARRGRLEQSGYRSGTGRALNNSDLYQAFYSVYDQFDCEVVKVRGHLKSADKNEIDQFFTLVDKAARRALREDQSRRIQG